MSPQRVGGDDDLVGAVLGTAFDMAESGGELLLVGELAIRHQQEPPCGFRIRAAVAMKVRPSAASAARPWWKGGLVMTAS